jgi:hypothetical protein
MKKIDELKGLTSEIAFNKEKKQFYPAATEHPFVVSLQKDCQLPDRRSSPLEIIPAHCETKQRNKGG